jgi:hypothetical protein
MPPSRATPVAARSYRRLALRDHVPGHVKFVAARHGRGTPRRPPFGGWWVYGSRAPAQSVKELSSDFDLAAIDRLNLPSITVEELSAEIAQRDHAQVLDARPAHYFSRCTDMRKGAIRRDPARIDEWSKELSPNEPVFVYRAYGFPLGLQRHRGALRAWVRR